MIVYTCVCMDVGVCMCEIMTTEQPRFGRSCYCGERKWSKENKTPRGLTTSVLSPPESGFGFVKGFSKSRYFLSLQLQLEAAHSPRSHKLLSLAEFLMMMMGLDDTLPLPMSLALLLMLMLLSKFHRRVYSSRGLGIYLCRQRRSRMRQVRHLEVYQDRFRRSNMGAWDSWDLV